MSSDVDFSDLMIFLTVFGSELPSVLRNPNKVKDSPRGKIWINKAISLGVIEVDADGNLAVNWGGLRELRKKVREVLENCLKFLESY